MSGLVANQTNNSASASAVKPAPGGPETALTVSQTASHAAYEAHAIGLASSSCAPCFHFSFMSPV